MLFLIHPFRNSSCTSPTALMFFGLKRAQCSLHELQLLYFVWLQCQHSKSGDHQNSPPAQVAVQAHLALWVYGLTTKIVREKKGFCLAIVRFTWMLHVTLLWHKKWDYEIPNRLFLTISQVAILMLPEMSFSLQLLHEVGCSIKEGSSA